MTAAGERGEEKVTKTKTDLILIVDDTEMNRALLADMLTPTYRVLEAADGQRAIDLLQQYQSEIALVLLDIVMPRLDGFEVLAVMNKNGWIGRIPVITISAETASTYIDHAYDLGAVDYISRPFDERVVQRRVKNTIMLYSKQRMLEGMVADQIVEKERNNYLMVEILSNIVEFRNGESGLHVLHIRTLTDLFLHQLQRTTDRYPLSSSRIAMMVNASSLHDVGKISIPEQILNKPGKLTAEEFAVMQTHSALGAQIMADALQRHREELLQLAYNICRWHHERYDGGGYPDGLRGDEIPIEAQVVALADVYDALTSVRVYKPAYPHQQAMEMILGGECGAFNPLLLQCLCQVGPRLEEELRLRSPGDMAEQSILALSSQALAAGQASSRTLTLLEQERTKYQFFAAMSSEIQFEYHYATDLLSMSEWGARQLALPMLIEDPAGDRQLAAVLDPVDYRDLQAKLRAATPDCPIVDAVYQLHVQGQKRWYKALARPLWEDEESGQMEGVIGKFVDVHERQLQLQTLQQRAEQDSLTGMLNHATARERIQPYLAQSGRQYAVALLDLDHFKEVNDRLGHMFGDQVLQYTAQRVRRGVRAGDITARIGGDEFLLFLKCRQPVEPVIRRIFSGLGGKFHGFDIAMSMGVALCPQDGEDYETLFHKADQALYAAKKAGKGRCLFYEDKMRDLLSAISPIDR